MDVRLTGAYELQSLSRRLRAEGERGKGLRKDLYRGIQRATKPLKADLKESAREHLPRRGGLNEIVAKANFSTRTAGGGRNVGVRVVVKGDVVRSSDRSFIRHPVYGDREVWVNQEIRGGWFTKTMQESAPPVRKEILEVMHDVANRIARG